VLDQPRDDRTGIQAGGKTVTLQVTPEEAQKIILAQELGSLALTLRSLWEQERSVKLDHATIHNTLGIPARVRYTKRNRYSVIRSGGY
jgi:pilus assembly protein CpaB